MVEKIDAELEEYANKLYDVLAKTAMGALLDKNLSLFNYSVTKTQENFGYKIVITIIKRKNTNYTIFKEGKLDESNFEWKKEIIVHVNFRDFGKEFLLQGIDNRKSGFLKVILMSLEKLN